MLCVRETKGTILRRDNSSCSEEKPDSGSHKVFEYFGAGHPVFGTS